MITQMNEIRLHVERGWSQMARRWSRIYLRKSALDLRKSAFKFGCFVLFFACLTISAFAKEGKDEAKSGTTAKEVEGQVTWIGKDKIAITYLRDDAEKTEYEILLPYNPKGLVVERKRNLGEIAVGDTVRAQYYEESYEYPDGRKEGRLKTKVISFVRPAPIKPQEPAAASSEEEMPLKGIKE